MPKLNKKNQEKQTIEDILAMEENNLLNRARSQGGEQNVLIHQKLWAQEKTLMIPQKWHKHWSIL